MARLDAFCQMPVRYEPEKLPAQFRIEPWIKGVRCVFEHRNGKSCFRTWGDKRIAKVEALEIEANQLREAIGYPVLLDGVIVPTRRETASGDMHLSAKFYVFDAIRGPWLEDRNKGYAQDRRLRDLKDAYLSDPSKLWKELTLLDPVNSYPSNFSGHDAVVEAAKTVFSENGRGVIIKDLAAFYKHGISNSWLKFSIDELDSAIDGTEAI